METSTTKPLSPRVVLGVAAHPDDLDFTACGTLAAMAAAGAKVYYVILTDGSSGSSDMTVTPEDLKQTRQVEQRTACDKAGVDDVFFEKFKDGALEVTMELKRVLVCHIRTLKPDVVVAIDPTMMYDAERGYINHSDHRAAGQATLDAVFPLSRDHLAFPELLDQGMPPHKVKTVLLTNFDEQQQNYCVDISDTIDCKLEALKAHASQDLDSAAIKRLVREYAKQDGEKAGFAYGECFVRIDVAS